MNAMRPSQSDHQFIPDIKNAETTLETNEIENFERSKLDIGLSNLQKQEPQCIKATHEQEHPTQLSNLHIGATEKTEEELNKKLDEEIPRPEYVPLEESVETKEEIKMKKIAGELFSPVATDEKSQDDGQLKKLDVICKLSELEEQIIQDISNTEVVMNTKEIKDSENSKFENDLSNLGIDEPQCTKIICKPKPPSRLLNLHVHSIENRQLNEEFSKPEYECPEETGRNDMFDPSLEKVKQTGDSQNILKNVLHIHECIVTEVSGIPLEIVEEPCLKKCISHQQTQDDTIDDLIVEQTPPRYNEDISCEDIKKFMSEVLEVSQRIKEDIKELKPDLTPTPDGVVVAIFPSEKELSMTLQEKTYMTQKITIPMIESVDETKANVEEAHLVAETGNASEYPDTFEETKFPITEKTLTDNDKNIIVHPALNERDQFVDNEVDSFSTHEKTHDAEKIHSDHVEYEITKAELENEIYSGTSFEPLQSKIERSSQISQDDCMKSDPSNIMKKKLKLETEEVKLSEPEKNPVLEYEVTGISIRAEDLRKKSDSFTDMPDVKAEELEVDGIISNKMAFVGTKTDAHSSSEDTNPEIGDRRNTSEISLSVSHLKNASHEDKMPRGVTSKSKISAETHQDSDEIKNDQRSAHDMISSISIANTEGGQKLYSDEKGASPNEDRGAVIPLSASSKTLDVLNIKETITSEENINKPLLSGGYIETNMDKDLRKDESSEQQINKQISAEDEVAELMRVAKSPEEIANISHEKKRQAHENLQIETDTDFCKEFSSEKPNDSNEQCEITVGTSMLEFEKNENVSKIFLPATPIVNETSSIVKGKTLDSTSQRNVENDEQKRISDFKIDPLMKEELVSPSLESGVIHQNSDPNVEKFSTQYTKLESIEKITETLKSAENIKNISETVVLLDCDSKIIHEMKHYSSKRAEKYETSTSELIIKSEKVFYGKQTQKDSEEEYSSSSATVLEPLETTHSDQKPPKLLNTEKTLPSSSPIVGVREMGNEKRPLISLKVTIFLLLQIQQPARICLFNYQMSIISRSVLSCCKQKGNIYLIP
ncbi:hypothetical protein WA026_020663 [Henosepilachna vigintioctopunctata]|uniref:Uncharacterized protein n=1 Tax=Henosepilachna vigintioctopunctata TaxID=420089 RepID=A0AAW1U686_9CUCU